MTTYFITRHPGAIDWAKQQGIGVNRQISHLAINNIQSGDTVIGSLPVNLAAEICQRGAAYIHMTLNVPEHWRGKELTAEQMIECGACLEGYALKKINCVQE
jgi:CRISPR-associated protein Csx16